MSGDFTSHNISLYKEYIINDKLYAVIKDTKLEDILFGEEYLRWIEEKRWYSTPEVAEWFGINDGQLRYYIKPFHEYLFSEDSPTSSTAFRLNVESILKLRMILLLKDEYRVKGLQKILGLNGEGYVQTASVNSRIKEVTKKEDSLQQEVAQLKKMMERVITSGLFEIRQGQDGPEINIKEGFLSHQVQRYIEDKGQSEVIKALQEQTADIAKNNQEMKELLDKTTKENEELKEYLKQIETNRNSDKDDVAIQIKEKRIENEIRSELRLAAVKEWSETHKQSFFSKLFQSERIEVEKENFIRDYIQKHLNERIENALIDYRKPER